MKHKYFNITDGKGFQLKFPNGVLLSTQFGWGNYCENNNAECDLEKKNWQSDNAEVAIIGPTGDWITRAYRDDGDDVLGYVSFDEWLKIVRWCENYKQENT